MKVRKNSFFILLALILIFPFSVKAGPETAQDRKTPESHPEEDKAEKPADITHKPEEERAYAAPQRLPHSIEGTGGLFITPVAYLLNPGERGKPTGTPSVGVVYGHLRKKDFLAATIVMTLWRRVEIGYGFNNLQLGDLRRDIKRQTGLDLDYNHVGLHHFNLRVSLIQEGAFGLSWMPAVTAGVHYKYNESIDSFNHRLKGVLREIGVRDNEGFDYTFTATKMIKNVFPWPTVFTAGLRATRACHIGLLGFSRHYSARAELSIAQFLTERLMIAGEFRSKPDKLDEIPGLVEEEDDWWTLDGRYLLNKHTALSFGYFHCGQLLNEDVNNGFALRLMVKF